MESNLKEKQHYERIIKVPLCLQETPYTCGVACVQSILASYGIVYHQDYLSEVLKQKPIFGTDYRNIISFMEALGFHVYKNIDMSIEALKEHIDNGITPILMIQAWKDDDIDYSYDWKNSHYVIACGYDDRCIIFMDPWTMGIYTFIAYEELLKRWHSLDSSFDHLNRTGLIIMHDHLKFIFNPNIMKPMD